ncbi:MAG: hypothetical protein KKD31_08805 [Bacteroidetes bacterium]|nr:hypothetical protein [Bacteroidota bacterium]
MKHLYILLALILSASVSFAQLTADAGADIAICEGSSQQLGGTPTATGGTAPYHYVWTPSAGLDNDTIANPLAIPGTTTTYVLTVTDDLSATATDEIVITVKPIPIAAASPSSQTICSGETTNISLSSNVGATSYAWTYSSSGPISGASNGSGNQISQYLTNSGNVPGSVTYHITPTADGCIGNQSDITVFVNPTPNAVASPSIQSICSGGCTSISLSSDVTGTTFSFSYWYNGSSQGTGNIIYKCFVNDGIYTDSIQFTITPTYNGCEGQPIHAYAAVLPKPVAYASPSSQIIDDGDTSHISLSSNMAGTTFTWTVSENGTGGATAGSGNIIEQQLHYANPPAIATYLIRPRKSGCYGNIIQATVQVRECSDCGVLSGLIYDDINNNGVRDAGEEGVPGIIVKATPFNSYTISDSTGNFSMFHSTGNITVSIPNPPLYHLVTTPPYSMNLTSIGLPNLDFGIHKLQNINDLKINYLCASASRPGFNTSINVSYKNNGTEVANGYVELQYDTICEFVSSQIIPTSHISNILTWDFSNLEPGESRNTNVTLNIPPTTPIGTVLHYEASVYPIIGDTTPPDNVKQLIETVTGSFDPNDKQADPLQISPGMLANNQEVTYTIRFQNTGNDTAFNVHIIDTLSANLDIPTFEFLSASHPYTVDISGQGIIDFTFSNILLPDSTTDETNSHGFVSYSVRPLDTLELGETVENTAYIYFDFNEAVQTNIVSTEIADNPMIIDAGHDTIICRHDTIQLGGTPTVTGGTPPYHYVWTPSAGLENDTIANPTALPTLTTVYSLTVTDSLGATASNTITISIPNPNAIATPVSDTICSGESTNFALSSDSAGASFSWTAVNGTGIIAGYLAGTGDSISQVLINPATMVGIVTYMVVPEINGCSGDTTDIIVVVGPPADASVYPMNAAICSGDSTHFDIFSQTGNTTLTWTASATGGISGAYDSSGNVISQLLENPGTVTGEVTYTITPITEFGCSGWPATATVSVNPIPQISTSGDICALPGQVVTLYASGATTYTWAPAYGLSSTSGSCIFANIGASIVYSVTGSTYGCSSTSTLQVTVPTSPFILADAGPSQTINCGGSGVIIGTPDTIGCTYSWSPTSGLSNPNIAQPTAAP